MYNFWLKLKSVTKILYWKMIEYMGISHGWIRGIVTLICILTTSVSFGQSESGDEANPYPDYQEDVFMDMEFTQNIVTPKVPENLKKSISTHQKKMAENLKKKYTIDLMRDNEVFVVCIPTDDIFFPNDTLMNPYAPSTLNSVLDLMKDPYMYKIVVAVHTDDTGSEQYRQDLSMARLATVYDWLLDAIDSNIISEDLVIVPYSMGSSEPLVSNDTRKHRQQNRRLEFYFIPGPKMIDLAKEHKLK